MNFEGTQLTRYLPDGLGLDTGRVQALKKEGRDVVITWGFVPETQLAAVLALRDLGFRWIWFDGNRDAARRAFNARGDVAESLLDAQLVKINAHLDLAHLIPEIVDTFDANGEFRSLEDITSELLR